MNFKLSSLSLSCLALALGGCDTAGDKLAEQYLMLEHSNSSRSELCTFAGKAASAFLDERNDRSFQKWEAKRREVCKVQKTDSVVRQGRITGKVSFPSDYLPKDIKVCARNVEVRNDTCKATGGAETYSMDLAPGRYIVWSTTEKWYGRAFYSKAVVCGLSVECKDHAPIEVTVESGETRSGIDPGDYFANN